MTPTVKLIAPPPVVPPPATIEITMDMDTAEKLLALVGRVADNGGELYALYRAMGTVVSPMVYRVKATCTGAEMPSLILQKR